jgi:ADP-ribose pyrophosphatase YjhB (NUDIX family)
MNNNYCNNCGKQGHLFNQCKIPITSIGVIAFRISNVNEEKRIEYLLIRRKETLGYIDFMRGKYSVQNKYYIMNMIKQMTNYEKECLKKGDFNALWKDIWGSDIYKNQYKTEEIISREKYNSLYSGVFFKNDFYNLSTLIEESNKFTRWIEPEWGFPKGRRNIQEKDYDCAVREFCEETGYSQERLKNIQNILPVEETFTGSNYKSYKHKYFIMYINYNDTLNVNNYQKSEVSKMEWKTYDECIACIRPYNLEKIRMITNVDTCLRNFNIYQF